MASRAAQRDARAARFHLAHDLRGPLNSLMVWTDVLQHHLRDAAPPIQQALAGLRVAVQQQADIIEAMLEQPHPEPPTAAKGTPTADNSRPETR